MALYEEIYGENGHKPISELATRKRVTKSFYGVASDEKSIARSGSNGRNWRGGMKMSNGYRLIFLPEHPKANRQGYVNEHVIVAEKALGKFLPDKAVPHHANQIRSDNSSKNIVICEDQAFHNLLHRRMRALKDCGHADWLKCQYCKCYDAPENLTVLINSKGHLRGRHKACHTRVEVERQNRKRQEN